MEKTNNYSSSDIAREPWAVCFGYMNEEESNENKWYILSKHIASVLKYIFGGFMKFWNGNPLLVIFHQSLESG